MTAPAVPPLAAFPMSAAERVNLHFQRSYRRGLDDYEVSDSPGYWRMRDPCTRCPGSREHRHTATYHDSVTRDPATGRWLSPYRTWRELREAASNANERGR
jgi:hypothetical protein